MIGQTEYRRSPWLMPGIALVTLVVIVGMALVFWNTPSPAQPADTAPAADVPGAMTQTNEGGQVTIKATWQGRSAGPIFDVVLDTHAVDLDGYDLQQLAILRIDGAREIQPTGWDAPKGGHHRAGTLTFPATAADGSALIVPDTRTIELVIHDIAGVTERVFRWTPST
ncbi:MAG: hypothetical protein ABIV47_12195 [Roseiflexaceae bacterium]